jgi:hypothetical protein
MRFSTQFIFPRNRPFSNPPERVQIKALIVIWQAPRRRSALRSLEQFARKRRPHLAGSLGVSMYKRLSKLGWIVPSRKSRAVRVTLEGREALLKHLELVVG